MASDVKQGPVINDTIQEVQGIFPSDAALQDAIGKLTRAGFDRAALSLPAANPTAAEATPAAGADNPNTEDDTRQSRTLHTSMAASVGAMVGAGVTVATGGAALAAAAAAVGLGALAGGGVSAAHMAVDASQAQDRGEAAALGQLVLSAATPDEASVQRARAAMQAAGASRVAAIARRGGGIT